MKYVHSWQPRQGNHSIVFKLKKWTGLRGLEKQTMEVGTVATKDAVCSFEEWPMDSASFLWESKIEEGYKRVR